MAEDLWNPPKLGAPAKYSVVLSNLYQKWPDRIARMFERRGFDYGNRHWGTMTYTTWKRRALRQVGGM